MHMCHQRRRRQHGCTFVLTLVGRRHCWGRVVQFMLFYCSSQAISLSAGLAADRVARDSMWLVPDMFALALSPVFSSIAVHNVGGPSRRRKSACKGWNVRMHAARHGLKILGKGHVLPNGPSARRIQLLWLLVQLGFIVIGIELPVAAAFPGLPFVTSLIVPVHTRIFFFFFFFFLIATVILCSVKRSKTLSASHACFITCGLSQNIPSSLTPGLAHTSVRWLPDVP